MTDGKSPRSVPPSGVFSSKIGIPVSLVLALLGGAGLGSQIPTASDLDIRDLKRDVAVVRDDLAAVRTEIREISRKRHDDLEAFDRRTLALESLAGLVRTSSSGAPP